MKFKRFYQPSTMQPMQVEEDVWEMCPTTEVRSIQIINEKLSDDVKIENIRDWCKENAVYMISNFILFDNAEQETEFLLIFS